MGQVPAGTSPDGNNDHKDDFGAYAQKIEQVKSEIAKVIIGQQEMVDLNELLEQVLLLVRKQMETLGIDVTWQRADGLPPVMAVPDRIRQVFLNVLLNAADAMPEGGKLEISAQQTVDPDGLRVAFADSGVGIKPEEMDQIFEPFHSTKPEGLGLGMFIMHRIVREHKGEIQINSKPGKGTTVAIWLPLPART